MEQEQMPHKLQLVDRQKLTMSGVTEVVSFDEKLVLLTTEYGGLSVEGENLRIGTLDVDRGDVRLGGKINGVYYYENRSTGEEKKGFFGKLFR